MYKYYDALLNRSGDALAGHYVRLFDAAGNQVDIYADESATPIITESGVANAAKSDDDGMVRFFVPDGDYDIRLYDAADTFVTSERAVPMVKGVTSADLAEPTTAENIGEANDGNVQAALDARAKVDVLASSSGGEMVGLADGSKIQDKIDAYESTAEGDGGAGEALTYSPDKSFAPFVPRSFNERLGETMSVFDSEPIRSAFENESNAAEALNDMFAYASAIGSATQRRCRIEMPGMLRIGGDWKVGEYLVDSQELQLKSNISLDARGSYTKLVGNVGHLLLIRSQSNIDIIGGTWDANFQGNDNPLAIGAIAADQSELGTISSNINVTLATFMNARHGGAHIPDPDDPADIGRGGGKVTFQIGARNIRFTSNYIVDCDLGISMEGIEQYMGEPSVNGYANDIIIANNVIENCRYMAFFLSGTPTTVAKFGDTTLAMIANNIIRNCASGQTSEDVPRDIAELFGVITCNGGSHYKLLNNIIRNEDGKTTVVRGSSNSCQFDLDAIIGGQLVDAVNTAPYGGYGPKNGTSQNTGGKIRLQTTGSSELSGYLLNNHATYYSRESSWEFEVSHLGNGTPAAISTAKYVNNLQNTNLVKVRDKISARSRAYDKSALLDNTDGNSFIVGSASVQSWRFRKGDYPFFRIHHADGATARAVTLSADLVGTTNYSLQGDAADFTVTIGTTVPTGSTGTASKINVFIVASTRTLYVENRLGGSPNVTVTELLTA